MSPRMFPTRIENRTASGILAITWDDGSVAELPHARLRAACPCSECRNLLRAGATIDPPADIRLAAIEPLGHNAVNLTFTDGHARGIYPFALLAELVNG